MRRVRQQYFTTLINSCSKISTNDLLAHMNFMSDPQKTGMNIFNTQYTVHARWLIAMYSLPLNKAVLLKRFYVPSKIKQSHRKGKKKNGAVRVCLQTLAVIILIIIHSTKTAGNCSNRLNKQGNIQIAPKSFHSARDLYKKFISIQALHLQWVFWLNGPCLNIQVQTRKHGNTEIWWREGRERKRGIECVE